MHGPRPDPEETLRCLFVSDLHGHESRYEALFAAVERERPAAVFLGGDLLPHWMARRASTAGSGPGAAPSESSAGFLRGFLFDRLQALRRAMGAAYPAVFAILGNDDGRVEEEALHDAERRGLLHYAHGRCTDWRGFDVYGYSYVPPTPFRLKDWERYDVSRFVDPGCISPEEGWRTVPLPEREARLATIRDDLDRLAERRDLARAIVLFHSPPYGGALDRAALDGRTVDHAPLDVHVGSIAIAQFIAARQPLVTLHGHIHESARLTGTWREISGRTVSLSAAHDGPELALVRFDPHRPADATRELL